MMGGTKNPGITTLSTGVPGLDEILGGGVPEYSFNLVAGEPGAGKTTLIHQLLFANATNERPALYFTTLGEPPMKMLRYQQQMRFFDRAKVGRAIRYVDLSDELRRSDLDHLLETILDQVNDASPIVVAVDSFRGIVPAPVHDASGTKHFLHQLALQLASCQTTTFLLGDYLETDVHTNPLFTECDSLIWLSHSRERNSVVRKIEVRKIRGQAQMPGRHTMRISSAGIRVFPRLQWRPEDEPRATSTHRVSMGSTALDAMMNGGLPFGDSALVAGPTGIGKTVLAKQFVAEGLKQGERCVIALFEEHPDEYLTSAVELGFDFSGPLERGELQLVYLRTLDLSTDETLIQLREKVVALGAKRFVFDSISGFELAIAHEFREEFREELYRLVGALTSMGVTSVLTVEVQEAFQQLSFSPYSVSFLTENVILLRYVEMEGELKRVLAVVKMRRSRHAGEFRLYEITSRGIVLTDTLEDYRGILAGAPARIELPSRSRVAALTSIESHVLQWLTELGQATIDQLVERSGLTVEEVTGALRRLLVLKLVLVGTEGAEALYRPLAETLGA